MMNAPLFYLGHLSTSHIHLAIKWSTRSDFRAFNVNAHCCLRHWGHALLLWEKGTTPCRRWHSGDLITGEAAGFIMHSGTKSHPWAKSKNCLGQVKVEWLCWGSEFVLWNILAVCSISVAITMPEQNILPSFFNTSLHYFSPSVCPFSTTGKDEIYKLLFFLFFFLSICHLHSQVLFQNLVSCLCRQHFEASQEHFA